MTTKPSVSKQSVMQPDELYSFTHRSVDAIEDDLQSLGMHALERLSKATNSVIDKKYHRHDNRHYRNRHVPEAWTKEELVKWFTEVRARNKEHERLYLKQFFYALRISEICHAERVGDMVKVVDEKMKREEYIPFIEGTETLFEPFNNGKGYNKHYIEKLFNEYRHLIGGRWLDKYLEDPVRYRLHSHGLRKTAATLFSRYTNGNKVKVQAFLRHDDRSLGTMAPYVEVDTEQFSKDVNACFAPYVKLLIL